MASMAAESTPRINAQYLEQFIGKTVRITGKIVSLRGDTGTLEAKGSITIHLNRDAHLALNNAAEIIGKVERDLSVRVYQSTDFGSNIDYSAIEAVVDATHRYKDMFYGDD